MRFDLLRSQDGLIYLIDCKVTPKTIKVGVCVAFSGLPTSIALFDQTNQHIATIEIPEAFRSIHTSATVLSTTFNLLTIE